jgi:hypothetical protein
MTDPFWLAALPLAALYCLARAIADIRNKRFVWGLCGMLSAILILTMPIPTHAISVDLSAKPADH